MKYSVVCIGCWNGETCACFFNSIQAHIFVETRIGNHFNIDVKMLHDIQQSKGVWQFLCSEKRLIYQLVAPLKEIYATTRLFRKRYKNIICPQCTNAQREWSVQFSDRTAQKYKGPDSATYSGRFPNLHQRVIHVEFHRQY